MSNPRRPRPDRPRPSDPSTKPLSTPLATVSRQELGRLGELAAANWLRGAGFTIEVIDLRTRFGQIDLLVRRRRLWIAVEVKTRRHHPAPERAVDRPQLARIERALRALAPDLRPAPRALRVDLCAVLVGEQGALEVTHLPGTEFQR